MLYISYFTREGDGLIIGLYPREADTTDRSSSKMGPESKSGVWVW